MNSPVYVSLEFTPNPNTLKYSVNRELLARGAANFTSKESAEAASPLAGKLFAVAGIAGVMIGRDFVTITKSEDGDWDLVHRSCSSIIEQHLTASEPIVNESAPGAGSAPNSEMERQIIEILDREVRPAVAMDGGDITFDRFEDGIVYLYMQGSCAGCPSSTMTLKHGIEARLKAAIPEIKEVVSL